jgi:hypothetical protein
MINPNRMTISNTAEYSENTNDWDETEYEDYEDYDDYEEEEVIKRKPTRRSRMQGKTPFETKWTNFLATRDITPNSWPSCVKEYLFQNRLSGDELLPHGDFLNSDLVLCML